VSTSGCHCWRSEGRAHSARDYTRFSRARNRARVLHKMNHPCCLKLVDTFRIAGFPSLYGFLRSRGDSPRRGI